MQATVNDVRIHWREAGAGDPLIFIHGFPFNSSMWDAQLAAAPAGWRFIAPDLRGFGESEPGSDAAYSMDLFADDVVALMDHLDIEQAAICGLSMGGYVALSLIMRHPDRVRALVLAATRASADSEEAKSNRRTLAMRARMQGPAAVIDAMLPGMTSGHTKLKQPKVIETVRAMMHGTQAETMARALEGMAARKDYTDQLARIAVSTFVIRGEQDELVPSADMEDIARTVRGARQEVIALAGHLPNLEATDVFNKILIHFLEMLPPVLKLGNFDLSF